MEDPMEGPQGPRFERDIAYHPYVSPEHRSWAYRKPLLLKRISDLDVDLLCCQDSRWSKSALVVGCGGEAANQQLSLVPDLEAAGYTALVPPRSKGSGGIEKPVTFYRPETFKVLASNYRSRANLHALQLVNTSAALLLANLHLQGSVRIDFIYHSPSLRRVALRRPRAPAEEQRLDWSMDRWPPWPQLVPNAWYPSDHVPVAASFALDDPT
eukprot:Skav201760  [mRNA]  locus=scaffold1973:323561:329737:- [translate_table: standard]